MPPPAVANTPGLGLPVEVTPVTSTNTSGKSIFIINEVQKELKYFFLMLFTGQVMLSKVTRNDPALLQYALATFGSTNLSEEDWKKAEDHYKINLLYQDMLRKRQEVEKLQKMGKNKYDYDSDEETDGGTWEHKLREKVSKLRLL